MDRIPPPAAPSFLALQVIRVSTDICKALAFLQDMRRTGASPMLDSLADDVDADLDDDLLAGGGGAAGSSSSGLADAVLSAYALRTVVTPSNVYVDPQSTKVSVLPALLNHLESALCEPQAVAAGVGLFSSSATPLHCDLAYTDPNSLFR